MNIAPNVFNSQKTLGFKATLANFNLQENGSLKRIHPDRKTWGKTGETDIHPGDKLVIVEDKTAVQSGKYPILYENPVVGTYKELNIDYQNGHNIVCDVQGRDTLIYRGTKFFTPKEFLKEGHKDIATGLEVNKQLLGRKLTYKQEDITKLHNEIAVKRVELIKEKKEQAILEKGREIIEREQEALEALKASL